MITQYLSRIVRFLDIHLYTALKERCLTPEEWESTVGLAVRAQITASSKLLSGSGTDFTSSPNTQLGFPGFLPINVYQMTQQNKPIVTSSILEFTIHNPAFHNAGYIHKGRITQIQLEQDSRRSIHIGSKINKPGVGFQKIVYEPDLRTGEEARVLFKELVIILKSLGTCTGNIIGSEVRVDASVSVCQSGEPLGTRRTEIKNLNSAELLSKSVDYEINRQIKELKEGRPVINETRSYDEKNKCTVKMQDKEIMHDYRFHECNPCLPPFVLCSNEDPQEFRVGKVNIDNQRTLIPLLPIGKREILINTNPYKFSLEECINIIHAKGFYDYLINLASRDNPSKAQTKVAMELQAYLKENKVHCEKCLIMTPKLFRELVQLRTNRDATVDETIAKIIQLIDNGDKRKPSEILETENWRQINDQQATQEMCQNLIERNPGYVMNEKPRNMREISDGSGNGKPDKPNEEELSSPEKVVFKKSLQTFDKDLTDTLGFVDKSLFIKAFFDYDSDIILITAPRRFCKSTNMDMLREFLLGKREIFEDNNLKLYKHHREFFDNNCVPNPVVHGDFKNVNVTSYENFLDSMRSILNQSFQDHDYLITEDASSDCGYAWSNNKLKQSKKVKGEVNTFLRYFNKEESLKLSETQIQEGYKMLCKWLSMHHSKNDPGKVVYLLLDEYDAPVQEIIINKNVSEKDSELIMDCLRKTMANLLKNNEYLKKALINACVRLAGALSGDAGRGIVTYCPFLCEKAFVEFYGFTTKEVEELLKKPELKLPPDSFDIIQKWYNGFETVDREVKICSNFSILSFIRRSREMKTLCPDVYWTDTGYVKNLAELFSIPVIRRVADSLLLGGSVEITAVKSVTVEMILALKSLIGLNLKEPDRELVNTFMQFLADSGNLNALPLPLTPQNPQSIKDAKKIICIEELIDGCVVSQEYAFKVQRSIIMIPNEELKLDLKQKFYNVDVLLKMHKLTPKQFTGYLNAVDGLMTRGNRDSFLQFRDAVADLFEKPFTMIDNEHTLHSKLYALADFDRGKIVKTEVAVEKETQRQGDYARLDMMIVSNDGNVVLLLEIKANSDYTAARKAYDKIFNKKTNYYTLPEQYGYKPKKTIYMGLHMNEDGVVSLCYKIKNEKEPFDYDENRQFC